MLTNQKLTAGSPSAPVLAALIALMLSGCVADDAVDGGYAYPNGAYAGETTAVPVHAVIAAHRGSLTREQRTVLRNFAQDATANAGSAISVRYPSGMPGGRNVALMVSRTLAESGVAQHNVVIDSYPGGRDEPVRLSFVRRLGGSLGCGNWTTDFTATEQNQVYPDFGCAEHQNIAAMVTNPADLNGPRPMTRALAQPRVTAMSFYYTTGSTTQNGSSSSSSSGGSASSGSSSSSN